MFLKKLLIYIIMTSLPGFYNLCYSQNKENQSKLEISKDNYLITDNFYPIMPWSFFGTPEYSLTELADCNFTVAGFVEPYDVHRVEKLGLKCIVDMHLNNRKSLHRRVWRGLSGKEIEDKVRMLVQNSGDSEAILGYFIMDEPSVLDFPFLGEAVAAVKKYAPDKLAYINLFPNYATLWAPNQMQSQLGTKTYQEYLERFVVEVRPQFVSYDNYMVSYSDDLNKEEKALSYFKNLLHIREVAIKNDLPYWNIISSKLLNGKGTPPSLANSLLQVYSSLAAGYSGIAWYRYKQTEKKYDYSPLDSAGKKTRSWYFVKEANRRVLSLGPIIKRLQSTGVFFSHHFLSDKLPPLPGEIIDSVYCNTPLMIGEFVDNKNNRYALIVNLSLSQSTHFSLSTHKDEWKTILILPEEGENGFSTYQRKFDLLDQEAPYWLTAGEGVLIKMERDG